MHEKLYICTIVYNDCIYNCAYHVLYYPFSIIVHLAGIAVGLQESQYNGTEGDELKLCVEATAGYIGRDFILSFETTDQTASVNGTVLHS